MVQLSVLPSGGAPSLTLRTARGSFGGLAPAQLPGRALRMSDRGRLEAALHFCGFSPAEYCFANLWLFRKVHEYRIVEEPVPYLRGRTYDGLVHALPLTRPTQAVAETLFEEGVDCLYPYGEHGPELAGLLNLVAGFNPADSDYWYRAADLAGLSAAKMRRSQARLYAEEHAPTFHDWSADLAGDAIAVLDGWADDVGRPSERTDVAECREAIAMAEDLDLQGGVVRVDGEPVAFLLASAADNARIVHFAKGRRAHSGAYPWMFAQFADRCGAEWINFEQDLGIPGLAQSKRAYGPARHQPKYRLRKSLRI